MLALVPAQAMATHNSVAVDIEITRADEVDPETGQLAPDLVEDTRVWDYSQRYHYEETEDIAAPERIGPQDQSGSNYDPDECRAYETFDGDDDFTQDEYYENALPGYNNPDIPEEAGDACYVGILDDQVEYLLTGHLLGEDLGVILFGNNYEGFPAPEAGFGAFSTHCLPCLPTKTQNPDPLYFANPEEGDDNCDEQPDLDDECASSGHTAYWPAYKMLNIDIDYVEAGIGNADDNPTPTSFAEATGTSEGSGTMTLPLLFTYKTFLYGYSHPEIDTSEEKAADIDQPLWGVPSNACGVTDEDNPDTIQRTPGGDDCSLLTPEDLAEYDVNAESSEDIEERGRLCDYTPQYITANPDDAGAGDCGVFGHNIKPFYETTEAGGFGTDTVNTYQATLPGYKAWFIVLGSSTLFAPLDWEQRFGTENTTGHQEQFYGASTSEALLRTVAVNPVVPSSNDPANCVRPNILADGTQIQDATEWDAGEVEAEIVESGDYDSVGNSFELTVTNDPAENAQPLNASGVSVEPLSGQMAPGTVTVDKLWFQDIDDLVGADAWLNVTDPDDNTQTLVADEPIDASFEIAVDEELTLQEGDYTVEVGTDSSTVAGYFAETFATVGNFQELGELPAPSIYGNFQAQAIDNDAYVNGLNGLVQSLYTGEGVDAYDGYRETLGDELDLADDTIGDVFGTPGDVLEIVDEEGPDLGDVEALLDEVTGTVDETVNDTTNTTDDVQARTQTGQAADAEPMAEPGGPNFAAFSNNPEVEEGLSCDGAELALVSNPDPVDGRLNFDPSLARTAISLEDPTILDDQNLPANKSNTSEGAWHTEAYSFSGPLVGYFDKGGGEGFDGCDPADGQPDPSLDDCAWTPVWDVYNPNCSPDDEDIDCADVVVENGYDIGAGEVDDENVDLSNEPGPHGVGLVATVELTGTTLVTNQPGAADPATVQEETEIVNQDPTQRTCLVITSVGFDEYLPGHVPGMDSFTQDEAGALCSEDTDEVRVFPDGFETQEGPNEQGFTSTVTWAPITPTPAAVRDAADIGEQRLCVSTVLSTQESVLASENTGEEETPGTSDTQSTVVLGADDTETYYTDCDVISQQLQDGEATANTGDEGTFNTGASLVAAHTGASS